MSRIAARPMYGRPLALLAVALAANACSRPVPAPVDELQVAEPYSEDRYTPSYTFSEVLRIDFGSDSSLQAVNVLGAQARRDDAGLALTPTTDDPVMVLREKGLHFNYVRVELAPSEDGRLELFWSPPGLPFARERRRQIPIAASESPRTYDVDLTEEIDPDGVGLRLRVDPIDHRADVLVRSIALLRAEPGLSGTEPFAPIKVKLGSEVRSAILVPAGDRVERTVRGATPVDLALGLAPPRSNDVPVTFRVLQRSGDEERLLLETAVDPSPEGAWRDLSLHLDPCPREPCSVVLAVAATAASERELGLFLSTPIVSSEGSRRGPNIILVSLDTLSPRFLSLGSDRAGEPTPHLAALGARGVVFDRAYAASSLTHSSHASLLTGSPPFGTRFIWLDGAVDGEVTLADVLRRKGYRTAAFTAGVVLSERIRFDRGFETYSQHDTLYRPLAEHSDVRPIAERALSWVDHHREAPFFLFLHTYEVHTPYIARDPALPDPPEPTPENYFNPLHMRGRLPADRSALPELFRVLTPEGRQVSPAEAGVETPSLSMVEAAHRSEIRYLDQEIARFLDELERRGVLADAIVAVTSDHGEAFFEHGLLEHGLLYDENLRVPLILSAPGRLPAGRHVEKMVASPDVAPTLLELAGIEPPPEMEGRSLLPLVRGTEAGDRSFYSLVLGNGIAWFVDGRYKLVERAAIVQESFGHHELFDLVDDPDERHDLISAGHALPPEVERARRETIDQFPGVHVDLGTLAGGTYELEMPFEASAKDKLYAFDLRRLERDVADPRSLRCTVSLSALSRLVILSRHAGRRFRLTLRPVGGGEPLEFEIDPPVGTGGAHERVAVAAAPGPPLRVWRVSEAVVTEGGFSLEEVEKLKTLGYVQ